MELNKNNYKKAMKRISAPESADDKILEMYDKIKSESEQKIKGKHSRKFRTVFKVAGAASVIIVLSCGSVFAYNYGIIANSKINNPAINLDHSDNSDVNGNEYSYSGGAEISEAAESENPDLSISVSSVQTDNSMAYIRFNVSTVNGESLITDDGNKKSILSIQKFDSLDVKINGSSVAPSEYFMFRVDAGNSPDKAVLELTLQNLGNTLAGKVITIEAKDYTDTYNEFNDDGKVISRTKKMLYEGTWRFSCDIPESAATSECLYSKDSAIQYGNYSGIINEIKVTDLQLFIKGKLNDYVSNSDNAKVSNATFLIYDDGTKVSAGNKMEGSTDRNGNFDRHWMLSNLVDAERIVAIEYSGNVISLK